MRISECCAEARERVAEALDRFSPEAEGELFACLRGELNRLCAPMFRAVSQTERFQALPDAEKNGAVRAWLAQGGFEELQRDFPLLSSALARATDQFSAFIAEFLRDTRPLGRFTHLSAYASDLHNGGKSAVIFSTESAKYVYKPRPCAADRAFCAFLDALSQLGAPRLPLHLRPFGPESNAPFTLVPFIENECARTREDANNYYLRCGALLALVQVLGSTDLHGENLIARVDSPILVDLETLLAGGMPSRGGYESGLSDGLMYSHLLPNWMLEGDENRDIGALSGAGKNQLMFQGAPCPAYAHTEAIQKGFLDTYAFLRAKRDGVCEALRLFDRAPFRKLLRPTEAYGKLCDQLLSPKALCDESARAACADRLRRAYARDADPAWAQKMRAVCESEIAAVLRGDIPYFFSYGGERCLRDTSGVVCADYFALSPVENAQKRLFALCDSDLRDQTCVIAQSFACANPKPDAVCAGDATQVFELLESRALENNPCGWIGLDTDDKGRAYLQSIGFDLYNGLLGVLCFYAALYEATGDARVKRAIQARYAPYEAMYVSASAPIRARADNINLTHGLGGHLLAHAYLARCLNDGAYLRRALRLFLRFDFSAYADFSAMDVYGGLSGLLAALPALMGLGEDAALSRAALPLANALCAHAPALTGYAHGAAGEALALACAGRVLGDDRYACDILRLLKAENETYDKENLSWPDLRDENKRGFMHGLCSGAPGIGLARLAMLNLGVKGEARDICARDIARVKAYFQGAPMRLKRDSLCCGNAARIEAEKALFGEVRYASLNEAPVFFHALDTNDFPAGLFQGWAGVGYALARRMPASKNGIFVWQEGIQK